MMDKHFFMIAGTLKEIGKIYKPGMVAMIKRRSSPVMEQYHRDREEDKRRCLEWRHP